MMELLRATKPNKQNVCVLKPNIRKLKPNICVLKQNYFKICKLSTKTQEIFA